MKKTLVVMMLVSFFCLMAGYVPTVSNADSFPSYGANEWDALMILNKCRIKEGKLPLTMTAKIQQAADIRAGELKTVYGHVRPNGTQWYTVFSQVGLGIGYGWENITMGTSDASILMEGWITLDDYTSMKNPGYRHIGIGYDSPYYWVQLFLSNGCSTNGFSLQLPAGALTYDANTKIEDFGVVAVVDCSVHGASYMPLISEMCTGFNSSGTSPHTVTAHHDGRTAIFVVTPKTNTAVKLASFPPDHMDIQLPPKIWVNMTLKPVVTPTKTPKPTPFILTPEPEPVPESAETFPIVYLVTGFIFLTPAPTVGID